METNTKKNVCVCVYTYIYIYVQLIHFAVQQKLTQHCKSTIFKILKNILKRIFENSYLLPCGSEVVFFLPLATP